MNLILFSFIVLFFVNSFFGKSLSEKDVFLLRLAMFFTVVADFSMVLLGQNEIGIGFFCIVQFIYCYRYSTAKRVLILFSLVTFEFIILNKNFQGVILLGIMYATSFAFSLTSVIQAFFQKKYPYPNNHLTLWGMVLFILCDVNVALSFSLHFGFSFFLIWLFYLPAQLLLSLSGKKYPISFR